MSTKLYQAKSLAGAQRRVRELSKQLKQMSDVLTRFQLERNLLAKLAAKGPAFYNPLDVYAAEQLRDRILAQVWNLNPDGSPIP